MKIGKTLKTKDKKKIKNLKLIQYKTKILNYEPKIKIFRNFQLYKNQEICNVSIRRGVQKGGQLVMPKHL